MSESVGFDFGTAIKEMKAGKKVGRVGWNGKGMWLYLIRSTHWGMNSDIPFDWCEIGNNLSPWIGMKTADNHFVPWLASQTDILSTDWEVVE